MSTPDDTAQKEAGTSGEQKPIDESLEVESHLRPSLLSSEAFANTENGYKGFVNLALLLLLLVNFRLIVENLIKYGLLFVETTSTLSIGSSSQAWPGTTITLLNSLVALLGLAIERTAFAQRLPARTVLGLEIVLVGVLMLLPCVAVLTWPVSLGPGILTMMWSTIIWMKMVSFFHVNTELRASLLQEKQAAASGKPKQQQNGSGRSLTAHLTVASLLRFFIIPSLVYEVEWAHTTRIRWAWLLRRVLEAIFLSMFIYIIALQYILPTLQKSVVPLDTLNLPVLTERILKLSIPLMYLWLLGFYVLFHLYLNIWAELTFMGDRRFYNDWWNSSNLGYFWRTWNLPVHRWMLQNIYKPMISRGWSTTRAGFMCFFVSAIFHEVIVSVPFRTLKLWAFTAMLSQLPMIYLTKRLFPTGSQTGNILFWCQLVLGLPVCVLMYYAYYTTAFLDN